MTEATQAGDRLMGTESKLLKYLALQSPDASQCPLYAKIAELVETKGEAAALDYFSAVIAVVSE